MLPLAPLVKVPVADRRSLADWLGVFRLWKLFPGGCYFVKAPETVGFSKSGFLAEGSADESVQ